MNVPELAQGGIVRPRGPFPADVHGDEYIVPMTEEFLKELATHIVGTKGLDGTGSAVGAGGARRTLLNLSPNHNSRPVRAARGGLAAAAHPASPDAGTGSASQSVGGGGGGQPHRPVRPVRSRDAEPGRRVTADKPVEPPSHRVSDPGSIPGVSTNPEER